MLRLKAALSAVFVAAGLALAVSAFVVSVVAPSARSEENPSAAQYAGGEGDEADSGNGYYEFYDRWTDASPAEGAAKPHSEGSDPSARAPAGALSIMKPPTPYTQVVDNATSRRFFSAPDWKTSPGKATRYGKDLRHTRPGRADAPAWFRVKIPTNGYYTVYARWPAAEGNNPKATFRVSTASGLRNVEVNQKRDGGAWVRLGAFKMEESYRYSVQVSQRSEAEGRIVADAIMVVAGTQAAPQDPNDDTLGGARPMVGGSVVASEVIERARTHLRTPYKHSPPLPCQAYRSEDCSCFTSLVFSKWVSMPDNPISQWNFGSNVEQSDLRPGDLVFFKEAGPTRPITHVAIYSGDGNILHASTYWGRVVESPMKYVQGYYGAKRLAAASTAPGKGGPARTMVASYYGRSLEGQKMANGRPFDPDALTAAHKSLPFGTQLEVSYGGKSVRVTITDRGPYVPGRDLDLSLAAARKLGLISKGTAPVRVRIV